MPSPTKEGTPYACENCGNTESFVTERLFPHFVIMDANAQTREVAPRRRYESETEGVEWADGAPVKCMGCMSTVREA